MIKVLFVCTGNICRSPMAEAVFQDMVNKAGLSDRIHVDSVGTSGEEVGNTIHRGTMGVLSKHGIPYNPRRPAREITDADFARSDVLLAMEHSHLNFLRRYGGTHAGKARLFLHDAREAGTVTMENVPDPWYDGQFDRTYDLVTKGCAALLSRLRAEHGL
ncbi:MAG: low molecular weight phosphotyrosine protein phosphatase [Anaerolineae bacterium]|nr:low molecular weight phosphotyrosine protein phosphatase [Anaerolineae bacterium]